MDVVLHFPVSSGNHRIETVVSMSQRGDCDKDAAVAVIHTHRLQERAAVQFLIYLYCIF